MTLKRTGIFSIYFIFYIGSSHSHFRYGHEIARLTQAQTTAKSGYDIARRGGVASPVLQDVKVNERMKFCSYLTRC